MFWKHIHIKVSFTDEALWNLLIVAVQSKTVGCSIFQLNFLCKLSNTLCLIYETVCSQMLWTNIIPRSETLLKTNYPLVPDTGVLLKICIETKTSCLYWMCQSEYNGFYLLWTRCDAPVQCRQVSAVKRLNASGSIMRWCKFDFSWYDPFNLNRKVLLHFLNKTKKSW